MSPEGNVRYEAIEALEIQAMARRIEELLVGRYVANPANLTRLREIFAEFQTVLTRKEGWGVTKCPAGWVHQTYTCRCMVPRSMETDG